MNPICEMIFYAVTFIIVVQYSSRDTNGMCEYDRNMV